MGHGRRAVIDGDLDELCGLCMRERWAHDDDGRCPLQQRRDVVSPDAVLEPFGEQAARCRKSACCACLARGQRQVWPTEPHHEPPRGRTQRSHDPDTVPLCLACHRERHDVGVDTFWARVGVSWVYVRDRMREGTIWGPAEAVPY